MGTRTGKRHQSDRHGKLICRDALLEGFMPDFVGERCQFVLLRRAGIANTIHQFGRKQSSHNPLHISFAYRTRSLASYCLVARLCRQLFRIGIVLQFARPVTQHTARLDECLRVICLG